ncbi:MAG: arylesterase [Deltaproteobacteria bacterium]|nr:arylesterase [Deltaproteobacteria bacterium]
MARRGLYFLRSLGACGLLVVLMLGVACGSESSSPLDAKAERAKEAIRASDGPVAPASSSARTSSASASAPGARRADTRPVVVFLGTSLTAGYGLRESEAYPALIQTKIDAAGLAFRVVNAGVSGDTSAGGLRRLDWLLRLPISVLVVELGANDMLRGQSPEVLAGNLAAILDRTLEVHPDARFLIAGMRAAPNLGRDYAEAFDATYPSLARRYAAPLVPFLLEDVAAVRRLNQADGIHPTAEGHALIADRVWQALAPLLLEVAPQRDAG